MSFVFFLIRREILYTNFSFDFEVRNDHIESESKVNSEAQCWQNFVKTQTAERELNLKTPLAL